MFFRVRSESGFFFVDGNLIRIISPHIRKPKFKSGVLPGILGALKGAGSIGQGVRWVLVPTIVKLVVIRSVGKI